MEEEKRVYREGHEPGVEEAVGTPEDEFEDSVMEESEGVTPLTAFLVAKFGDRVEIVSEIGMKMDHVASMSEIRDMATVVSQDAQVSLLANRAAQVFTQSLVKAAASKQKQDRRIVTPMGVGVHGRKG